MKKSKIKIYGIVITLIFISIFGYCIFNKNISKVSAEDDSASCTAGECSAETDFKEWDPNVDKVNNNSCEGYASKDKTESENTIRLMNRYYGINYVIDNDIIKISSRAGSTGKFKIIKFQKESVQTDGNDKKIIWTDIKSDYINGLIGKTFDSSGITFDLLNFPDLGSRYSVVVGLAEDDSTTGCKAVNADGSIGYLATIDFTTPVVGYDLVDIPDIQKNLCNNFYGNNLDYVYDGTNTIRSKLSHAELYRADHINDYWTEDVKAYCNSKIQTDKVLYYVDKEIIEENGNYKEKEVVTNYLDRLISIFDAVIFNYETVFESNSESVSDSTIDWSVPNYNDVADSAFYFGKRSALKDGYGYVIKGGEWYNIEKGTYEDNLLSFEGKYSSTPTNSNPFDLTCESNFDASTYKYSKGDVLEKFATSEWKWDAEGKSGFYNLTRDPSEKSYNIKANVKFLYGVEEKSKSVNLSHTFTSGLAFNKDVPVCKITCEEVVEVNYGPPIASSAGLCFQYQAQVSSTVKCTSEAKIHFEGTNYGVCDVYPYCAGRKGSGSWYEHQGGSNEEFDECIYQCDGGKYTDDCSEKCYSSVYDNSNNGQLLSYLNREPIASKVLWWGLSWYGKYKLDVGSGAITWTGAHSYARYYREHEYNRTVNDHGAYLPQYGIKRHNNGGSLCGEECHFEVKMIGINYPESYMKNFEYLFPFTDEGDISRNRGLKKQSRNTCYLNPEDAQKDFDKNKKEVERALNECKAAATCTTKTATFTFDVSYTDSENGSKTTVHFPYTSNDDKNTSTALKSSDKKDVCKENSNVTNIDLKCSSFTEEQNKLSDEEKSKIEEDCKKQEAKISKSNSVVISYDGCYRNCKGTPVYNTRWTFPMLWRNTKTNRLTYINTGGAGYEEVGRQFCLIRTAADVNEKYWYEHAINNLEIRKDVIVSDCSLEEARNAASDKITYNILGKAVNFGHFGWDLNIKCFYALATPTESDKCASGGLAFKTRSVDLADMFPKAEDGSSHIPFNWSDNASFYTVIPGGLLDAKGNPDNIVVPFVYRNFAETMMDSIYSNDYLDYEFSLSPTNIRRLKKLFSNTSSRPTNSGNNYILSHGIYSYRSPLIRSKDSNLISSSKYPLEIVLGCNNIENYKSTACKSFDFNDNAEYNSGEVLEEGTN